MLVITGTPGVGKHTIGKQISQDMKLDIIDINEVAKSNGLVNDTTNDIDTDVLGDILRPNLTSRSLVIGHLAPYVLDVDIVTRIIILRRNPYELETIYNQRGYSKSKTFENMASEILAIIAFDTIVKFQERAVEIDVSKKTVDESVCMISSVITDDIYSNIDVDWLSLVEDKHDIRRIFGD